MFSTVVAPVYILTKCVSIPPCPHRTLHLLLSVFQRTAILTGVKWYLIVVLICISTRQMDSIKLRSFSTAKKTINAVMRHGRKYFQTNYLTRLILRINQEPPKFSKTKTTSPVKKWTKSMYRRISSAETQTANKRMKNKPSILPVLSVLMVY